ncbi:uncharacterized protein LOC127851085 isoform X2 [Dreissena polymorpha]|uniref:uncharacterized protein LOC127851085 isoform X1 n=3 Tax=Dreissena polymorpha TaxID=45954 RepID=UPI0022644078|nr:uncharacterized protein LOC127851085 isoform X1 [Dreissena polymorpha]XP_052240535.1 uncharacterized protein LOC127851085 isoform X2 [Dreissena polymorpha]
MLTLDSLCSYLDLILNQAVTMASRDGVHVDLKAAIPKVNLPTTGDNFEASLDDLSPTSRENLKILLMGMREGEVKLKKSTQGRLSVHYEENNQTYGTNANRLCAPQSNELRSKKLEDFFDLIELLKQKENPSGVVIDKSKISYTPDLKYREGNEFSKVQKILGVGNASEGDIYVIADKKPGVRHAVKTVAIRSFRCDEIRCWMDLNDTGHVPKLYLVKLEENTVKIHMEALETAITFSKIIEEHLSTLASHENLAKPFSMYLLKGALEAVSTIHKKEWAHNDVGGGNIMLESDMKIKIIDFGSARKILSADVMLERKEIIRKIQEDILGLLTLVIQLYTGERYIDTEDMLEKYSQEKQQHALYPRFNGADRTEMAEFVDLVMEIVHPDKVEKLKALVEQKLGQALNELGLPLALMLTKVTEILFPEIVVDIHGRANLQEQNYAGESMGASSEPSFLNVDAIITMEKLDQIQKTFSNTLAME